MSDWRQVSMIVQLHQAGHMASEIARRAGLTTAETAQIIETYRGVVVPPKAQTLEPAVAPRPFKIGDDGRAFRGVRWSPELLACLGKMPDAQVAKRFGFCPRTAALKRRLLGIPRWHKPEFQWTHAVVADLFALKAQEFVQKYRVPWRIVKAKRDQLGVPRKQRQNCNRVTFTSGMIALLGKRPDERLARSFKTSKAAVTRKRRELGIPSFRSSLSPWTRAYLDLLGKIPDPQLAKKMGVNISAVAKRRWKLGIRPCVVYFKWTKRRVALLGTMPDAVLAAKLGLSLRQVMKKRHHFRILSCQNRRLNWTPERIALPGTMPDVEVAKRLGARLSAVVGRRRSFHIPTYAKLPCHKWTAEERQLLGTMPDRDLALRLGVSADAVRLQRTALGITAARRRRGRQL
jgi:hypothetical protein